MGKMRQLLSYDPNETKKNKERTRCRTVKSPFTAQVP